jgi:hypothetical protein
MKNRLTEVLQLDTQDKLKYGKYLLELYYKDNFYAFVKDFFSIGCGHDFKPHFSVEYVCENIEYNIKGYYEWGIYNIYRGWGKSDLISVLASTWALLRDPTERIGCYSRALTEDAKGWHDKSIRLLQNANIIENCNFTGLQTINALIARTKYNGYRRVGSCLSSSVGSDLTMAIVDDPADQEHPFSEAKRRRLRTFFENGLLRAVRTVSYEATDDYLEQLTKEQLKEYNLTKELESEKYIKNKRPRMMLVMQRLSYNDFTSTVLEMLDKMREQNVEMPHTHVIIPAIHEEPKTYVFPKTKNTFTVSGVMVAGASTQKDILRAKEQMTDVDFLAQMQQNPQELQGNLIRKDHFLYYTQQELHNTFFQEVFIVCDTASKTGEGNDNSALSCWGVALNESKQAFLYLLDLSIGKWDFVALKKNIVSFYRRNGIDLGEKKYFGKNMNSILSNCYVEDASSGTGLLSEYKNIISEDWYYKFISISKVLPGITSKPKYERFSTIGGRIQNQRIKLPDAAIKHHAYNNVSLNITQPFLQEVCTFTHNNSHAHDDITDCLIYACHIVWSKKIAGISLYE